MIRWGLVGTGAIANKRVGPGLVSARDSKLVAVCDVVEEAVREFAGRFNVPYVYTSFDDLLANQEIDAVYLATPIFLHGSQAIQALRAGKHVLVEKPMALTVAEGEEMIQVARETGKTLATAYYRRFFPKVQRAQQLIGEGTLGKVVMVVSVYHTWYDPAPGAPGSWRSQKARAGGGVLWDMGSHRFDLLVGLFGMPTQVWAITETLAHDYEVEDTASVYMKLGNGAQCVSSWQWSSQTWVDHLSIIGTHGKIVMEPVDSPNFTLYIGKGRSQERFDEEIPLPENVHLPMIQNFVDSVLQGIDPVEVGEEGIKINRILAAIDESAAKGCIVVL
ncbi:MAG TPA: Gfo/Idh/MocA family oxidoreductase [Anaerolineae bacterium]|nr:Gfo/Idh/MocA family oxidoreductase [Anaerolineae bacterium]